MKRKRTEFPYGADRADGLNSASWRELKRLVLVGLPRRLKLYHFKGQRKRLFTVSGGFPNGEPLLPGFVPAHNSRSVPGCGYAITFIPT